MFDPDAFEAARRSRFWGWDKHGIAAGRDVDATFCTIFEEVQLAYKALYEKDRDLIFRKYALGEVLTKSQKTQVSTAIGSMTQRIAGRMGHETVVQQFHRMDRERNDPDMDPGNVQGVNARGFIDRWDRLSPESVLAFDPQRVQEIIDTRREIEGVREAG
jgi:hypothetical protein